MRANGLVTVCEEAACPNIGECWSQRHATMMIMGDTCTRACAFCNVRTGQPGPLAADEPDRVADAVAKLGLRHVVITSVDRDDLPDGGAAHFAATIRAIRAAAPATTIEVLTPDFLRKPGAVELVVEARPDVYNHNLETVPRLYPTIRPGARYFTSLSAAAPGEAARSVDLHQVRPDGGPGRNPHRDHAGDGRPAHGGGGFPHHRPVPAADASSTPRSIASSRRRNSPTTRRWRAARASCWSPPRR